MLEYLELDLRIEGSDPSYRVHASSSLGEISSFEISLSLIELSGTLIRLRQLRLSPEEVKQVGQRLFRKVFTGNLLKLFRALQEKAHGSESHLRILLTIESPELAQLPWEYLYDSEHGQFLSLSIETPLIRFLPLPERPPLPLRLPLRILVAISNPRGMAPLDVDREWEALRSAFRDSSRVELVALQQPTVSQLLQTLRQNDFHIFHFIGHGTFDDRSGEGGLLFEGKNGEPSLMTGERLGAVLHDERTLRLAVFNACEGAAATASDPFAGLGQSIVRAGLPAVIAMQTVISDEVAIAFARELYMALADGFPVHAALAEARKLIYTSGSLIEWGAPVLFLRSRDGRILEVEGATLQDRAPQPVPPQVPSEAPPPVAVSQSTTRDAAVLESVAPPPPPVRDSSQEPRFWLATDSPPELSWDREFNPKKSSVLWRRRGAATQKLLEQTVPGDPVLAYRTLGNFAFGLAMVNGSPAPVPRRTSAETTLPLQPVLQFDVGISLDEIRRAVPTLRLPQGRIPPWMELTAEQWTPLRSLILHRNPGLPAAAVPTSKAPETDRPLIEKVELLSQSLDHDVFKPGDGAEVRLTLRNQGSIVWWVGLTLRLTCRWWSESRPSATPAIQSGISLALTTPVAPGETAEITGNVVLPSAPALYRVEWLATTGNAEATKIQEIVVNRLRPFVDEVQRLLAERKVTKGELAAKSGYPRDWVEKLLRYEIEAIEPSDVLGLAGPLDVSFDDLLRAAGYEPIGEAPAEEPADEETVETSPKSSGPGPQPTEEPTPGPPPVVEPPPAPRPAAVPPAVQATVQVTVPLPPPPPEEQTLAITVEATEVELRFRGRTYRSPLALDAERLVEAASPDEYGRLLFEALIRDEGVDNPRSATRKGYDRARDRASEGLRIEIEPRSLELQEKKWEYLVDPRDGTVPLAALQGSPFYRRLGNASRPTAAARPLRILAAIANPRTLGRVTDEQGKPVNRKISALAALDPVREREILDAALGRLQEAGIAEYRILDGAGGSSVTHEAILEEVQKGYHVLHLLAHGLPYEASYHLVLEDAEGRHRFVEAEEFARTLRGVDDLRLAVLASCQSATPDTARSLRGLGARLAEAVPAVVAMQGEVRIDTAQLFTQRFYDHLARTGRVDMAMAATRFELHRRNATEWQWGFPVLMMSGDDGRLFDVDEARAQAALPPLEPRIKSYPDLAPEKLGRVLETAARDYGIDPALVGSLRAALASPMSAAIGSGAAAEPITRPQDRGPLQGLVRPLALRAGALAAAVVEATGLDLPATVYGQIASALNSGKHVILIGPPGTGKTSLAHAVCDYARREGFTAGAAFTTATADWTTFDTVGGYVPTAQQSLQFRAGKFLEAIRDGRWLVIDEINRAEIDKAFGELFTVLAGQRVDLPYSVGASMLRVLPPGRRPEPGGWIPDDAASGYDFVIHPNWRVVGTMNVYDKANLFNLSFAFMRRFAFVDVDLPPAATYAGLIDRWLNGSGLDAAPAAVLRTALVALLAPGSPLMACRELGPAIVQDMIEYVADRHRHQPGTDGGGLLCEALLLYVTPQLDGIDRQRIGDVRRFLAGLVGADARGGLERRIQSLYPYLSDADWGEP